MIVSVILPIYNEFQTLPQVLDRVLAASLPEGCTKEVIIVDDGSTDGTTALLENYHGLTICHHSTLNSGKGTAIRIALKIAKGDVAIIQDGDLEYDPNDYLKILTPIIEGKEDIVYGSRFLGQKPGMAWKNRLANKILTVAANVLYGARITDEATAYKAFRMSALHGINLRCRRFEFCPEVTAKLRRAGYAIHEVPISYNARGIRDGKKIRARDGFEALWTLLRYRFSLHGKRDSALRGDAINRRDY
jgi:dolichol-phosphate mannosyltransferase